MSIYGTREVADETFGGDISGHSANYENESHCERFNHRLMTCVRESQELDVLYDCRSRLLDFRECVLRHKQSTWAMRETMASLRNETRYRQWLRQYDEAFGHPPLLEAVEKVRAKVAAEGGESILNPTVFKDPDLFISKSTLQK